MNSILCFTFLAGAVSAQLPSLPVLNNVAAVAAVSSASANDGGFRICSAANQKMQGCVAEAGGLEGLNTVSPFRLALCACCDGDRPVAATYSSCSVYMASAMPSMSSELAAYGDLYSMCNADDICPGGGSSRTGLPVSRTALSESTQTSAESTESASGRSAPGETATPSGPSATRTGGSSGISSGLSATRETASATSATGSTSTGAAPALCYGPAAGIVAAALLVAAL